MYKKLHFLTNSDVIQSSVNSFIEEWLNDSDYITVQSSGSTGKAKNIRLNKKYVRISAQKTIDHFKIKKGGRSYLCLSADTIGGKMMIVRSIINEMELIVGNIRTHSLVEVKSFEIDFAAIVPLQLAHSLENIPEKIKNIKTLLVGGGSVSKKIEEQMILNNCSAYQTYGMSETISHVAVRKLGIGSERYYSALREISFTTEEEKLVIHFPEIGVDSLKTNDLVRLINHHQFEFIGRADFIINSGGKKFNPEVLESLISSIIDIPYFIGALNDELLGSRIILFLESENNIDEKRLIEKLKLMMPNHSVPKKIICTPRFILTKSGKINRHETIKLII